MKNSVELIGFYGGDKTHACSAWTSTSRALTPEKEARIPKLLNMLASNGHETPFEKSAIHFLVNCDIASHIHLLKHRIGVSINAESARYKELKEDNYYIPDDWPEKAKNALADKTKDALESYHQAIEFLVETGMSRKRAKESARFLRPYNTQIECDIMFNWRSFVHFYKLRAAEDAQVEIQEIANLMLEEIKSIPDNPFQESIKAFGLGD